MSKVLIKAQTTLDEYGAELPPKRQPPISPEEQEFNFDRAVDASSASSLEDIYNQPYDSRWAGEMIDSEVFDAKRQIARDLLQGDSSQYSDWKEMLENIDDHEIQTSGGAGAETLPESLRQYYSRQSTLPEHMPTLHTPNWQMEDGSIRPGSIPAINAVRRMDTRDIDLMMQGAGLVPVHNRDVHEFEEHMIPPEYRFDLDRKGKKSMMHSADDGPIEISQNELGYFVSPSNKIDVGRAQMDDDYMGLPTPKGYVGIRGLNTKDDKLQMRPPIGNPQEKNTEGLVQSRIPPSRLVPIKDRGVYPNKSNILYGSNERQRYGDREPMLDSYRNQVNSVINEYPEVWDDVKHKKLRPALVHGSNLYQSSTPPSWGVSGRENPMVGVTPRAIENILNKPNRDNLYDFNQEMARHLNDLKHIKKEYVAVDSSREAPATLVELQNGDYAGKPEACTLCGNSPVVVGGRWKNPLGNIDYTHHLCEPCADQYDIMHSADMYRSEDMIIGDVLVKAYLPTLQERGRKLEDQTSLRWIPRYHEKTFNASIPFDKDKGNVNWEQRLRNERIEAPEGSAHSYRVNLPGVYTGSSRKPNKGLHRITGNWVAPATQQGAMGADVSFNDRGLLMGIEGNPDWWRTVRQGAAQESPAGEGFKYGGFDKEAFSKIPTPNISPIAVLHYQMALEHPMGGEDYAAQQYPDVHELLQQFPDTKTEDIWGPAASLTQNPLLDNIDTKVASEPMSVGDVLVKELNADLLARNPNRPYAEFSYDELMEYIYGDMESGDMTLSPEEREKMFEELNIRVAENQQEPMRFSNEFQEANKAVPMSVGDVLVKRQTTLSAYDPMQIESNLEPQNSNIFIAAKPGNQDLETEELSRLSDEMLAEIAALKQEHGEFGITSATGNAEWEKEPSFMLTNVPDSARQSINDIAARFNQDAIGVSEKDQAGADFITPQGEKTDSFEGMAFEDDPMYSTDFPTGQRLTFKGEAMKLGDVLVKERISPEAKRHKLEYDKKYESNPVRVKYREDLNRERRKRHIYGQGGPDMSHTSQHTIVPEDPHTNRARHFKSKGTLL